MTTSITLPSLKEDLQQPFPVEQIKFLPKSPRKDEQGRWSCLALPYVDKRSYEDRLNELAFGAWSTPSTPPFVAGNKLIVPVTLVLCEVVRTDYGEAFLSSTTRGGEAHEEENSATVAYSQGFRRACAQFGLGRYLYNLTKAWVPYDHNRRAIVLSAQEHTALVARLYREAGLRSLSVPGVTPSPQRREEAPALPSSPSTPAMAPTPPARPVSKATPAVKQDGTRQPDRTAEEDAPLESKHFNWILRTYCVEKHIHSTEVCQRFGVNSLKELSHSHFIALVNEYNQVLTKTDASTLSR